MHRCCAVSAISHDHHVRRAFALAIIALDVVPGSGVGQSLVMAFAVDHDIVALYDLPGYRERIWLQCLNIG